MKKWIISCMAALHSELGRNALALPEGVRIRSFIGKDRLVPYSEIKLCKVEAIHERIRVFHHRSDERYHLVMIITRTPYAMKMTKDQSDTFIRHLEKHAPHVTVSILPESVSTLRLPED